MSSPHSHLGTVVVSGLGVTSALVVWLSLRSPNSTADAARTTLDEQRRAVLARAERELLLSPEQAREVERIVCASPVLGQGNPQRTIHPMTREECQERRATTSHLAVASPRCNEPNMVVAFDPARGETEETATLCIDQFEFPNLPCEYPLVHVTAREAAALCQAVGKRLCDAHEWEGACAGAVRSPSEEYAFGHSREVMTSLHNSRRALVWAYGKTKRHELCATGSAKTEGCTSGFARCGSNTYPAGAFPECVSSFGVYDQHGNVAEHMNLPSCPEELAGAGGLGYTEMKGSWFIFASFEAHEDDCRWRATDWHPSRVRAVNSHSNYHLGFRCCLDIAGAILPYSSSPAATSAQQRKPVE